MRATRSLIDLRDLQWAVAACRHRSLRQAALALNVHLPTYNRALRDLEGKLGYRLFERSTGGTRPSREGREFLATARRIMDDMDVALARLLNRNEGKGGRLALGVQTSFTTGNLKATLEAWRQIAPDVELDVTDETRGYLLRDVVEGVIDLAIVTDGMSD